MVAVGEWQLPEWWRDEIYYWFWCRGFAGAQGGRKKKKGREKGIEGKKKKEIKNG